MPTILKKILKILGWIVVSIILLFVVIVLLIRLPSVQNYIVGKVEPIVENKIGTTFNIDRLYISFPKNVTLEGLYLEDQSNDTLASIGYLEVNIGLLGLLKNEVNINNVLLENTTVNLVVDSTTQKFNFDFIIESFQGDTTQKQKSQSSWQINPGGLALKDIRFSFVDPTSSMDIFASLKEFETDIDNFELDSLDMEVDKFYLSGAQVTVKNFGSAESSEPTQTDTTEGATPLTISLDDLEILNSRIQYTDSAQNVVANIASFLLEKSSFSLKKQLIQSERIALAKSFVRYEMFEQDTSDTAENEVDTASSAPWKIEVQEVEMEENEVKFDNHASPDTATAGMDFNHLHISRLLADINDISINGSDISANIESLRLSEKSGFTLREFHAGFAMAGERIAVDNLRLQTDASSIAANAEFFITPFLEHSNDRHPSTVSIRKASIGPADLEYFAPEVHQSLPVSKPVSLKGEVRGWLDDLDVSAFHASIDSTGVDLTGHLSGLPEMTQFSFDVPEVRLKGTARGVKNILPDTLLPATLQLPENFEISASAKGYLNDMKGLLKGKTSMGDFSFDGSFKNDTIQKVLEVDGQITVEQFELGSFLQNPQLGAFTTHLTIEGNGADFTNTDIKINGAVDSVEYNEYTYKGLKIDGQIKDQSYRGKLSLKDDNIWFYFDGLADMKDSIPEVDLRLDLVHADLQSLNFVPYEFIVSGVITADIDSDDQGRINGEAAVREAKIIRQGEFFAVDSIVAVSLSEKGKTEITLNSVILNAQLSGNVDVLRIAPLLQHHFNQYFTEELSIDSTENVLQEFEFSAEVVDPTILTDVFVPPLETLKITTIKGSFNNVQNQFTLDVDVPQVVYGSFELDTLTLSVNSNNRQLTGNLHFALLKNDFLYIDEFNLDATSAEDALDLLLTIPLKNKNDFKMGAELYRQDSAYYLKMDPENLVFNGQQWTSPENNYLKLSPALWFENFAFQNGNKKLAIESRVSEASDTSLYLTFQNFELKNLTEPFSDTVNLASGVANGSVHLLSHYEGLSLNSDLRIQNLSVVNSDFGNLTLTSHYKNEENIFNLSITGSDANLTANGAIFSEEGSTQIEADTEIENLQLSLVYPFVKEYFAKLQGELSGNISFKTAENFPEIDGRINFSNVNATPNLTGVEITIENEQLRIRNENVILDNFRINAANGGSVTLSGNLNANEFPDYQLDFDVSASNFMVLNTTDDDNETYYGKLQISGNADVQGNQDLLNVNADVQVEGGSELVYVVPQEQASVITSEGLVRWIDTRKDSLRELTTEESDTIAAKIQGIDLTANISINKQSRLSVIIDQQTGDRLNVSGDADLTLTMPPAGDMSLTGRYEISEGSYNLNFYEFVKREFVIVEGSSILWTGDPLEAQLDVTTRYIVETLPPLTDIARRIPFYVNLMIDGKILEPELSFSISLSEENQARYPTVYGFLQDINQQENQLNKQVFSLIVFNSFMATGTAGSGEIVSNTARQSLSKILSQQLNKLAGKVEFVELDLNVESYETGSSEDAQGRTDLELGVSKSLFNNRVTVRVEGNVNLEDEGQTRQEGMSSYSGDIIIEYKITEDGVYRLQAFSKEEYDALYGSEITRTGIGIIMVRDYNNVKDLFKREKKIE